MHIFIIVNPLLTLSIMEGVGVGRENKRYRKGKEKT